MWLLLGAALADAPLAWMVGCWKSDSGLEEVWIGPSEGVLVGASLQKNGSWEHLRVEPQGKGFVLIAHPKGQAETRFVMAKASQTSVTFQNAAHDFPQRIRYDRGKHGLKAVVGTLDGSKSFTVDFRSCERKN